MSPKPIAPLNKQALLGAQGGLACILTSEPKASKSTRIPKKSPKNKAPNHHQQNPYKTPRSTLERYALIDYSLQTFPPKSDPNVLVCPNH